MSKASFDFYLPLKWVFFLFVLFATLIAFLNALGVRVPTIRCSKSNISELFGINKRTLNGWIDCFASEDLQKLCHGKRTLSITTAHQLIKLMGNPNDFPVLNRKVIIELGEGVYSQLTRTVNRVAEDHQLPKDKLAKMRIFPPAYAKIIAADFGIHPSEIAAFRKAKEL